MQLILRRSYIMTSRLACCDGGDRLSKLPKNPKEAFIMTLFRDPKVSSSALHY